MKRRFLATAVVVCAANCAAADSDPSPIQETPGAAAQLGYATVADALAGMKAKPGVRVAQQGGWTIVDDEPEHSLWSFTPEGHPAYPSVVRRTIKQTDGNVFIQMVVLCQAQKQPCDQLVRDFEKLNDQIREYVKSRGGK